ncbi:putative RNA-directed DNA polymerase [Arabidopsis thaliana]
MHKCFHMKDLGKLKYLLGIEVSRGPDGIFLTQRKYANDIITEAGLLDAKTYSTPMEPNHKLASAKGHVLNVPKSIFMQTPLLSHWDAAIRVVRYLKGCPAKGIMLRADSEISLIAYYDSDWSYSTISKCVCCLFRLLSNFMED